ncbi:hypothetical protein F5148DRAFT_1154891 [Russula earlei]|uniref:Uncharacterized protein n=1 Tax=Russula earlei TaxID=71964 RepID=A0ACC0TQW3_9AGAM|nr:hypothetical protein F5148DRAFT_1154891 [Russula earlei]
MGKTLLTQAVVHHMDCKFIHVSGSKLVQKCIIGKGSHMVCKFFVIVGKHALSIIFVDEIASIGSSHGLDGFGLAQFMVTWHGLDMVMALPPPLPPHFLLSPAWILPPRGGSAAVAQSSGEGAAAAAHVGEGMGIGVKVTSSIGGGMQMMPMVTMMEMVVRHVLVAVMHQVCKLFFLMGWQQLDMLADMTVRGGVDVMTPVEAGKVAIAYDMLFNLAWEFQFLYKPLTTLQLPPFSTINKPPCLALLPPLLNDLRLLHIKLSMPVALWAVLNSIGCLLAPQLPDNLFNFKDKSIITYQLIWLLKWLPFNQWLLLHNIIDKLLPLLFLPLLLLLQGPILLLLALALALLLLLSMDLTLALFPLLILLLTPPFLFLILTGSISICQLTWLLSLLLFLFLHSQEVSMSLPL